jgi:uncharacterized protein (TIGR03067 family)
MDKKLPSRPNLQFLKRVAKELLAALAAGEAAAARTFVEHLPAARGMTQEQARTAGFRLADAQSAMARANGFASWPDLAHHVEQLRSLEGSWQFASLEIGGEVISAAMLGSSRILIDGDRFRTESPEATYEGEFTIDVAVLPHTIDIEFVAGPEAGKWSYGIYRLEGDQLTICLGLAGQTRPAAFATTPGSGHALETLRRSSSAQPAGVTGGVRGDGGELAVPVPVPWQAAPLTAEHQRLEGEWRAVHLERDGMVMPAAFVKGGRRVGKGTSTVVRFGGQVMIDAETRIDPTVSPIAIDYRLVDGAVQYGILEWTNDGVRFCFAMPGLPRPTEFAAAAGSACTLSAWRRS